MTGHDPLCPAALHDPACTCSALAEREARARADERERVNREAHRVGLCLCGHELDDHAIADLPRCHLCACFGYRQAPKVTP